MKPLKRLRKLKHPVQTTVFNKPNRPKIHISSITAVFQQYIDRESQIRLLFSDPWGSEMQQARQLNLSRLYKRLDDYGLSHRFDWNTYLDGKYDAASIDSPRKKRTTNSR